MVYTRLHVLLIDINKIEIGSDSNFGGKVKTSFVNISCLRKNITKYSSEILVARVRQKAS